MLSKTQLIFAANLLAMQWRKPSSPHHQLSPVVYHAATSSTFSTYYDEVQDWLQSLAGMDELLTGTVYSNSHKNYLFCNRNVE